MSLSLLWSNLQGETNHLPQFNASPHHRFLVGLPWWGRRALDIE